MLVQSLGLEDPQEKEMVPTPVLLSEEFHGQRSLAGYSPWGRKELDRTEWQTLSIYGSLRHLKFKRTYEFAQTLTWSVSVFLDCFFSIIFEKITNVMPIVENLQIHKYEKSPSVSFAFDVTAFFLETHIFCRCMHFIFACVIVLLNWPGFIYIFLCLHTQLLLHFFLHFVLHTFSNHFLFFKTWLYEQ